MIKNIILNFLKTKKEKYYLCGTISQNTKFDSLLHFLLKNIPPFDLIFSINFCYI